jgi:predicted nucleic-acid-binding Zn-ribbon protein
VDHINKIVWENMKCIGSLLKLENNDFENYTLYTPPSNMSKAISIETENHININCGRRHSCIMLDYHLKIIDQVLNLGPSWPAPL